MLVKIGENKTSAVSGIRSRSDRGPRKAGFRRTAPRLLLPVLVLFAVQFSLPGPARAGAIGSWVSMPAFCAAQLEPGYQKYDKLRLRIGSEAGKRHLDLAKWCENRGLLEFTREQLAIVSDLSQGSIHRMAWKMTERLSQLRESKLKERFHPPSRKDLELYRQKLKKISILDRKDQKKLADLAHKYSTSLGEKAYRGYKELVLGNEDLLLIDDRERIVLDVGTVPRAISERIAGEEGMISINDQLFLRQGFLKHLTLVKELSMADDEVLRVFGEAGLEEAESWQKLGLELCAVLAKDLDASFAPPFNLAITDLRPVYEAYCDATGLAVFKASQGFFSLEDRVALICTEGPEGGERSLFQTQCIVLHELTHLLHADVTRIAWPSWYAEGVAETYGGAGTFVWNKGRLEAKGLLARPKIDALLQPGNLIELDSFLSTQAAAVNNQSTDAANIFYAQAWAFLRYLRTGAGGKTARRLRKWEDDCIRLQLRPPEATRLLQESVTGDLTKLQKNFVRFLEKL